MLNKKSILLTTLLFSPIIAQEPPQTIGTQTEWQKWNNVCLEYLPLAAAGFIGAVVGKCHSYILAETIYQPMLEHCINLDSKTMKLVKYILLILSFVIEQKMRNELLAQLEQSLEKNTIEHDKNNMDMAAFTASFLTHLNSNYNWQPYRAYHPRVEFMHN